MANNPEERQYNIRKWAEQAGVGKHLLIWKFFMAGKEIPEWTLIKALPKKFKKIKEPSPICGKRVKVREKN